MYGALDVELSDLGREEARAAAEYLRTEAPHLDAVYASGLKRAIYGAEQIALGRDLEVRSDPRFNEIDRGVWVNLTREEVARKYPEHMARIGTVSSFRGEPDFAEHGGENYRGLARRVYEGRNALLAAHAGGAVCLVCHNWVVASLVGSAQGVQSEEWHTLRIPTASVALLEYLHEPAAGGGGEAILEERTVFVGKSPSEYTQGRLQDNAVSELPAGKG